MNGNQSSQSSSYLQYLPSSLQADPFLGRFLLAFERILSSSDPPDQPSPALEEYIERISTYFNPGSEKSDNTKTPAEFLPWLAGWVALSLRDDWAEETKRQFIREIVPLYRLRGTKTGLENILKLYLRSYGFPEKVEIFEFDNLPHYFQVQLTLPNQNLDLYWRTAKIALAIIDQEKPVHTFYALKILVPTMRLTGNYYPIALKQPGTIAVTVNVDNPGNNLILNIKGSGQAEPYAKQAGKNSPLTVSYTVTPEQFKLGEKWHLAIANLSSNQVTGKFTVTFTYAANSSEQPYKDEKFTLESGLKIGKPPNGNTVLGTETRKPEPTPELPT
ncbi:phage tail protein [Anabaena sp. UHCC 0399]|uniref:phage tail protein n=1 Tax=Anabaena sp. UHCC 0399 TaxID=3110238 RepID=UPI002B21DD14|nr:phage tail protein [Anabaena sp. UHCC 0399]MEA5567768.1 phage tail protein [Anabaena sp. UHCC 0399]